MNKKGFTLIELLVVILIIGILLALIIPNFVLFQERARRTSVKNNMHVVQTALEAYSVDHLGLYPNEDIAWDDATDETGISPYFPGGDPIGEGGDAIPGNFPVNPYTGARYNVDAEDLTYTVDDLLDESGMAAQVSNEDDNCPWQDYESPEDAQGAIDVQGYVPEGSINDCVQEYGVIGWGRDLTEPIFDRDPSDPDIWIFFVLHN